MTEPSVGKCSYCKEVMALEDKTVLYQNKWYHERCFTSVRVLEDYKTKTQKDIKKLLDQKPEEQLSYSENLINSINSLLDSGKGDTGRLNYILNCIKNNKPLYNTDKKYLQSKIDHLPQPKPLPVKASKTKPKSKPPQVEQKIKPLTKQTKTESKKITTELKSQTKPIVELKPKKPRIDPVLILISLGIFAFVIWAPFTLVAGFSTGAMALGGILVMYQLLDARRWSKSKFRQGKQMPGVFPIFLLVLPFVFGGVLAFEGYTMWDSAYRAVILWGFTITFWSIMLMVPLSLYSKYKEDQIQSTPSYPLISVLIPAYNEQKVIAQTIEAVLETDYPHKEVIVIDDGSQDSTLSIAKRYEDKIKVLHKENGGKASALNYGLTFAKGELIAVLDADTIVGKTSLQGIATIFADDKNVAAVAGNVKVRNKVNWLTWCQALEYVAGLQIARRAFDLFGAITIVPGALGTFKKSVIQEAGAYDKETIVEDFDLTVKVLKSGQLVRGTTKSTAYTEAPSTLGDFVKQRKRWYRGNLQVLFKHRNALTNPRFGFLQKLAFPYMVLSMLVLPVSGFFILGSAILAIIQGDFMFVLGSFAFFIILQYLLTTLAVRIDGDDPKLILFSVFFIIGFKQILDVLLIRQALEQISGRKARWTSAKRTGFDEK